MADNKDGAIPVVTQSGKVGYLPEAFAKDAPGVRRATDAEMAQAQHKANQEATDAALKSKFEGAGAGLLGNLEGQFAPSLAGAARGLSFGLSDQAAVGLGRLFGGESGAQGVANRLSDYKEYDPFRSFTGEMAGVTAHALLGDEAGAAEAGSSSLARIMGRGAVEGAVYGAGDAVSEAALKNHDLTAESIIGGAAHGALGGAVAAGVMGGLGKAYSALRPKASALEAVAGAVNGGEVSGVGEELAQRVEGGAYRTKPSSLADSVGNAYIDALPVAPGEKQRLADVFANREKAFASKAEVTEKATRDTASAFDDALSAGRKTDMASFGEAKVNQMSRLVDNSRFDDQSAMVVQFIEHADPIVQAMQHDANSAMTKGELKQWNGWIKEIGNAIAERDSLALHTAMDDMKRWTGKQAEYGTGPFGKSRSAREFDHLYHGTGESIGMMPLLESNVWGDAAAKAQKEVNAATANMISQGKLFTRKFSTQYGDELGRPLYRADPAAISGFYGRLTNAANDLDAEAAQNFINARRRYLDAATSNYTYTAAGMKEIGKERAALDRMEKTLKSTTEDVSRINQVSAALSEERERGIGGAVGAVLGVASQPHTMLRRIAMAEQQTKNVAERIFSGTKSVVSGEAKKASVSSSRSSKGFFTSLLDGVESSRPVATKVAGKVGGAAAQKLFARRADQIGALNASPDRLTEQVSRGLEPLGASAPKVSAAAVGVAARGVSFLQSKLPSLRIDSYSLQPGLQVPRASDAEVSQFFRFTEALDNPLIVLDEARKGTLSRDHVEAVKNVYPALYEEMRGAVFEELTKSKKELPYSKRIQLGILLDLPTDRTLSPEFIQAVQSTYTPAESAGAPSPNAPAPDLAGSFQTDTQHATEGAM